MKGAHRRTDHSPVVSALVSLRWLMQLAGLLAATVAIVGIPIYVLATNSKLMPIVAAALQGTVAIIVGGDLALKVMRNRKPPPAILADWIGASAGVIVWVVALLVSIGSTQGWMHGAFEYAVIGICALLLIGTPVYQWRGRQRLVLALTARAAARRWPWSAG